LFQIKNSVIVIALYLKFSNITRNLQIKFESKSDSNRKYKTENRKSKKRKNREKLTWPHNPPCSPWHSPEAAQDEPSKHSPYPFV
jgi:hypothetical protein